MGGLTEDVRVLMERYLLLTASLMQHAANAIRHARSIGVPMGNELEPVRMAAEAILKEIREIHSGLEHRPTAVASENEEPVMVEMARADGGNESEPAPAGGIVDSEAAPSFPRLSEQAPRRGRRRAAPAEDR